MAQNESPTIQVEETQYDANKEPYVQASQPDPKNRESPPTFQKPKLPGQLMTPATPRTRPEPPQTPPLGPAPTQFPDPQSPSDDGSSDHSDDGPEEEHREKEEVDPQVLPQFDWEGLEAEYFAAMNKVDEVEAKLGEEFRVLANYFAQWSNVSIEQDRERAVKRFRTRQEHIYNSEDLFAKKKEHHEEVVTRIKSVMALMDFD